MNLLLHMCCGPCACYPVRKLRQEGQGLFQHPAADKGVGIATDNNTPVWIPLRAGKKKSLPRLPTVQAQMLEKIFILVMIPLISRNVKSISAK